MIDLPMMAKLLAAIGPEARLVLLGDMDQLASVDPGAVLGDICRAHDPERFSTACSAAYQSAAGAALTDAALSWDGEGGLEDCLVRLSYSRRFPPESAIGRISVAVNQTTDRAGAEHAWGVLQEQADAGSGVHLHDSAQGLADAKGLPRQELRQAILAGYRDILNADQPLEAFAALGRFRILCATRRGPFGVARLNRLIEDVLSLRQFNESPAELGLARALQPTRGIYDRQVVMVTRNDYDLGLFNGDVGIVFPEPDPAEPEEAKLVCWFEAMDADGNPALRSVPCNLLPDHETAFAMTIHKSQGSEFDNLLIVLPGEATPLLSRELLYTALTRARTDPDRPDDTGHIHLWCTPAAFQHAAAHPTTRSSGLRVALARATAQNRSL